MAKRIELSLRKFEGGLLPVTVVPPTSLSLSIGSHRIRDGVLVVEASGTVENLPNETSCGVTWRVTQNGKARSISGSAVPLAVKGTKGSVSLKLDLRDAGLVGKVRLSLRLTPDFPPYRASAVSKSISLDLPCQVDLEGFAESMEVGHPVTLTPRRHEVFADGTVRARLVELDARGDDLDPDDEGAGWEQAWEWGPGETEARRWRVGCTDDEGEVALDLPDPGERGPAELALIIELVSDQSVTRLKTHRATVARPRLRALKLKPHNEALGRQSWNDAGAFVRWLRSQPQRKDLRYTAEIEIDGLAPGFALPVELTLWGHRPMRGRPDVRLMCPLTYERVVHTDEQGRISATVLDLSTIDDPDLLSELVGYTYFLVLRLPAATTGGEGHVPVVQVLRYDAGTYVPFMAEDFAVATPTSQARSGRTPKDLGTGVCSPEIGSERPIRLPHFASLTPWVRGNDVVFSARLVGPLRYWNEAEPELTIRLENGQTVPLTVDSRDDDPWVIEGAISIKDRRIVGKCIEATVAVTNERATIDGTHRVGTPAPEIVGHECKPKLGPIEWTVEQQGDRKVGRLTCVAHHFPTSPGGTKGLRMSVMGKYQGIEGLVPLGIDLRYSIPDGKGRTDGRVARSGLLEATVTDQDDIERFEAGRTRVEVWRHFEKGKVYGMEVPKVHRDFGKGARKLPEGEVIWGKKVSAQFKANVLLIASQLGIEANDLMAVMAFETGAKFLPGYYKSSGAVGLIQFTSDGAKAIKSTKATLAAMTAEKQLFEVQRYLKVWIDQKGALKTLEDVYMAVFCPAGIGKSLDHVLYSAKQDQDKGVRYYAKNKGLDTNDSKTITKREAAAKVREKYQQGLAELG